MTLPDERYRAVRYAREFLYELLDPKKTPRIPKSLRRRASSVLRHFPGDFDMERIALGDTEMLEISGPPKKLSIYDDL